VGIVVSVCPRTDDGPATAAIGRNWYRHRPSLPSYTPQGCPGQALLGLGCSAASRWIRSMVRTRERRPGAPHCLGSVSCAKARVTRSRLSRRDPARARISYGRTHEVARIGAQRQPTSAISRPEIFAFRSEETGRGRTRTMNCMKVHARRDKSRCGESRSDGPC
jgi:hypothetical protein